MLDRNLLAGDDCLLALVALAGLDSCLLDLGLLLGSFSLYGVSLLVLGVEESPSSLRSASAAPSSPVRMPSYSSADPNGIEPRRSE